jgi:PadR family transcriptional regulator, regulatory protein PadR
MNPKDPRVTKQMFQVLRALIECRQEWVTGSQIVHVTNLRSGILYPILIRLEQSGWLSGKWETGDPHVLGRPLRHYYRVTTLGLSKTKALVKEMTSLFGGFEV